MEYYVWEEPGRLVTRTATFRVAGIVPDRGRRSRPGADVSGHQRFADARANGIRRFPSTCAASSGGRGVLGAVSDDAESVRAARGRAAAVALAIRRDDVAAHHARRRAVTLDDARRAYAQRLRAAIDPLAMGLAVRDVRADSLDGVARRHRFRRVLRLLQLLPRRLRAAARRAVLQARRRAARPRGRPAARRRVRHRRRSGGCFSPKGCCSSIAGSALGVAGALGYASLLMYGLRTWWVDAVGTTALTLHVTGDVAGRGRRRRRRRRASVCIWWTLRSLVASPSGACSPAISARTRARCDAPVRSQGRRLLVVDASCSSRPGRGAARGARLRSRVGSGRRILRRRASLLLGASSVSVPAGASAAGRDMRSAAADGWPVSRSGCATRTYRPGRSVLSIAVIASATFILISVDAFRRDDAAPIDRSALWHWAATRCIVDTLLPIVHDPNTQRGTRGTQPVRPRRTCAIEPFRVRARRRCELPEPVRADEPADSGAAGFVSRGRAVRVSAARWPRPTPSVRTRGCSSARQSRTGGAGDRRRELDDLRAAPGARRRYRDHDAAPSRCGCVWWRRCATVSSRASC